MSRAPKRIEKHSSGLLPKLVDLLVMKREPDWRPFAVEDLIAVLLLEYGMDYESLDAAAMGSMRGFSRRSGLDAGGCRDAAKRCVVAYFAANPLPGSLTRAASPVIESVQIHTRLRQFAEAPMEARPSDLPWISWVLAA